MCRPGDVVLGNRRWSLHDHTDRYLALPAGVPPYRRFDISWQGFERDVGLSEDDRTFKRDDFLRLLNRFFESEGLSTDWSSLEEADNELLINSLSMLCPFDPEDKQALLEAPSLTTRRETLIGLLEYALQGGSGEEMMQ
jgi:Lon protease-like protein